MHSRRSASVTGTSESPLVTSFLLPLRTQETIGYEPHPDGGEVVSDVLADPYAHFLSSQRGVFNSALKRSGYDIAPDRGHPFENRKWEYLGNPISGRTTTTPFHTKFWNSTLAWRPMTAFTPLFEGWMTGLGTHDVQGLEGFAQRAYAEAAPSLAEFSLTEFLGELREGLPKAFPAFLSRDRGDFFRSVGSDYLNVQFGWIPFLNSIRDFASSLARANYKVNAVEGVPIRRHVGVPVKKDALEVPEVRLDLRNGWPEGPATYKTIAGQPASSATLLNVGTGHLMQSMETRISFAGAFVNHLPKSFDDSSYISRLGVLMDLKITPSVLWQLAPWSWLADWFQDIHGAIRANEIAVSDTVLTQYAYASQKTVYRTVLTGTLTSVMGTPRVSAVMVGTAYKRIRANPYGFSVGTFGGLNSHQMSILAALGLSQKR